MMNRSGIETYELLRLDEVALAGYFDLEDTRFEEWYEKNRAVGDRLYSAILDRKSAGRAANSLKLRAIAKG